MVEAANDGQETLDYRFTLAKRANFPGWIRTALALIAGGVAVVQLVPALSIPGVRHALGAVLTAAGGVLAMVAVWLGHCRAPRFTFAPRTEVVILGWATAGFASLILVFSVI